MPFGIGIWEIVALGLLALSIYSFVVCWQKGRKGMFWWSFAGIIIPFVGILHLIGALRIARPDSTWAQQRYGVDKMAKSRARFGDERLLAAI